MVEYMSDYRRIKNFAFQFAFDGVFEFNDQGDIVDCNDGYTNIIGYKKEELVGQSILMIRPDITKEQLLRIIDEAKKETKVNYEAKWLTKDRRYVHMDIIMIYDILTDCFFCFAKDITELKQQEKELNQIKQALDLMDSYLYIKDKEGYYLYANEVTLKDFCLTKENYRGKRDLDIFPEHLVQKFRNTDQLVFQGQCTHEEIEVIDEYGTRKIYLDIKAPMYESDTQINTLLGVSYNITEQKRLENEIKELSIKDSLTDVYNRRYVFERLDSDFKRFEVKKEPFSITMIDIDYFKSVNDVHGHVTGDYILKEFAQYLAKSLDTNGFVGRYGGEEFIIVFYDADKNMAKNNVENILNQLKETSFEDNKTSIQLTFSAGVSDITELESDSFFPKALIELADQRLYLAKECGRNRVVC